MSENSAKRIGTLSAVLAALGASAIHTKAHAETASPRLTAALQGAIPRQLLASVLLSDRITISKILVGSKVETLADGYNKVNEYTQGGGSDSFHQYSQDLDRTPISKLVLTSTIAAKLKTLNFIR